MATKNLELCIVDTYMAQIYDFTTPEKAESDLAKAIAAKEKEAQNWDRYLRVEDVPQFRLYAERAKRANMKIMTYAEFKAFEREKILFTDSPLREITKEKYEEMLDVLPPLAWRLRGGIEMFCLREFLTDTYTTQYAHDRNTGKYYCKVVDLADRSTWIDNALYPAG